MKIAVIPGDGIGPEVIEQGVRLLSVLVKKHNLGLETKWFPFGAEYYLKEGIGLPKGFLETLQKEYAALYFGALGDPRIPDMRHGKEILLGLRFGLDLYVNLRPVELLDISLTPLQEKKPIEIHIFRENTQDIYLGLGGSYQKNTVYEVTMDESLHTYRGVKRILEAAFLYAENHKKSVCLVDKSNAILYGGDLWQRVFLEVSQNYTHIRKKHLLVDNAAMQMVLNPSQFQVVVTSNLFGDILSDLGAGLVGGPGLCGSANLNEAGFGLFEPVHGSAPDIAGKSKANPFAAFLSLGLMLSHLGFVGFEKKIKEAIQTSIREGIMTPDLGGNYTTTQVGDFILSCF